MGMNQQTINTLVAETLLCDITTLIPEKRLVEDLLADSITMIDLVSRVSDHYNIDISEQDLLRLDRLSDLYNIIDKYTLSKERK